MSTISGPLTHLLSQDVPWKWTVECSEACAKIKDLLVSSKIMAHYNPHKPLELAVDASGYGLGAVISHSDGLKDNPIAYASRTLTAAEKNYSQIEKEALAIIFGVTKFHSYLYGRKFTLITDHKPLTTIFGPKKGIPVLTASRLQRWAIQLAAYQFDIKYRATGKHQNADTLSRFPVAEEGESRTVFDRETELIHRIQLQNLPVTAEKVAAATKNDIVLSRVMEFTKTGWPSSQPDPNLLPFFRIRNELTIEDGCLLRGIRVVIPEKYRHDLLDELHVSHPGMVRMKSLARLHVWWPGLNFDIETKVSRCEACRALLPNPPKAPANPWLWPSAPWKRVHIDYAGPFMQRMFLIVVDAYSKWIDVVMMTSTTSESTINALRYLFSSYGLPVEIVSDNGPQFVSEEFETFLKENGIRHIKSAPYHPASNGEAERAVRTFKQAMKNMASETGTLNQKLAAFLLSYRTTPHTTTNTTPSELFFNRKIRTRLDVVKPQLSDRIHQKSLPAEKNTREFKVGDTVMVRDYRGSKVSWIKSTISRRLGPVTYHVSVCGMMWKRHVDQIRKCDAMCELNGSEPRKPSVFDCIVPMNAPLKSGEEPFNNSGDVLNSQESLSTEQSTSDDQQHSVHHENISPTKSRYPPRERRRPQRLIEQC